LHSSYSFSPHFPNITAPGDETAWSEGPKSLFCPKDTVNEEEPSRTVSGRFNSSLDGRHLSRYQGSRDRPRISCGNFLPPERRSIIASELEIDIITPAIKHGNFMQHKQPLDD
jgi:hypothetical protein